MREDDCVMPQRPTHDTKALSSRAGLLAPDVTVARPEQGHVSTPPAHFDEAQAEQVLWQEFRDHSASLNNTLNEALRINRGPAWRVFQVRVLVRLETCSPVPFASARL
jgi:hypothetical protein